MEEEGEEEEEIEDEVLEYSDDEVHLSLPYSIPSRES